MNGKQICCREFRFAGLALLILVALAAPATAGETTAGLGIGATAGFGVQGDLTFHEFTRNAPLSLRLSGAYSVRDAGNALAARSVFINDNTNGTPEQSASTWQLRLDLMLPIGKLGSTPLQLGFGARKSFFTATFDFVGGNEKFDVVSNPWGAGVFVEAGFEVSDRSDFTIQLGVDYFFNSRLEGHGTAYEPDGDDVNPRLDYTWDDADDAVNQPQLEPLVLIGLRVRLGS